MDAIPIYKHSQGHDSALLSTCSPDDVQLADRCLASPLPANISRPQEKTKIFPATGGLSTSDGD
jgi:hypothetical protein